MGLWVNFECWARDRVGVTVGDVIAQHRREGLLLSDEPNGDNCWKISRRATWDGAVPELKPEVLANRRREQERFLATWDGSIGKMIYPDGREVRIDRFEKGSGGNLLARLMKDDLLPHEPDLVSADASMPEHGWRAEMAMGFAMKPFPE